MPKYGCRAFNQPTLVKTRFPPAGPGQNEKGASQHGTKSLIESWATLTRRLGPQGAQGDPLGLFRSHYEWLAITIGQHTVSGNWDGAMTGRPDALGALQF